MKIYTWMTTVVALVSLGACQAPSHAASPEVFAHVSAVAALLAAAQAPQHPSEVARAIKGTNAKGVAPVLDALTSIGQARRLADGRYAA